MPTESASRPPQGPIHLYTSTLNHEARVFAERLAENLQSPALVHDLSELPTPDERRCQQLRAERAQLTQELGRCRDLVQLYCNSPALAREVIELEHEAEQYAARLWEIDAALGEQPAPPQPSQQQESPS